MEEAIKQAINQKGFKNYHQFYGAMCGAGFSGSYQCILNWIDGKHKPNADGLYYLNKVLKIPIAHLFNHEKC